MDGTIRASTSAPCSSASSRWRASTACAASMCSMPATAICTRWCCSTARTGTSGTAPSCSAPTSWKPAWNWAAPSPVSTASAWRSSIRCACSSLRPSAKPSSPSRRPSTGAPAQSRQGHPDPGALRRVRQDARAPRAAAPPRPAALLTPPCPDRCNRKCCASAWAGPRPAGASAGTPSSSRPTRAPGACSTSRCWSAIVASVLVVVLDSRRP